MKICMIGAGHAGTTIALALYRAGHTFTQVYSRNIQNAEILSEKIHATSAISDLKDVKSNAELYVFSLPDDHTAFAFSKINIPFDSLQIVAHTSGSLPHNLFQKIAKNSGVLYFPQTMSKTDNSHLEHCPAIVQGSNSYTTEKLKTLASGITERVSVMDDDQRKFLHISAIFSHNFTNYMYTIAEDICSQHDIEFSLLYNLIDQGVEKMKKNGPSASQTGPAARNDQKLIDQHVSLLKELPEYQEVYARLSSGISARNKKEKL